MTIEEAISRLDRLRPNQYSCEDKVRWLSQLDHMAANEIYASHEGWQPGDFTPYTEATDTDTPLLLPAPYSGDIYQYWLEAQVDRCNGEIARYNTSITLFNTAYQRFRDWYHREHRPLRRVECFRY